MLRRNEKPWVIRVFSCKHVFLKSEKKVKTNTITEVLIAIVATDLLDLNEIIILNRYQSVTAEYKNPFSIQIQIYFLGTLKTIESFSPINHSQL